MNLSQTIRRLFVGLILLGGPAWASSSAKPAYKAVSRADFLNADLKDIANHQIVYSGDVVDFGDWSKLSSTEKDLLVLYPAYVEPTVSDQKDGKISTRLEKLTMFISRTKVRLNVAGDRIDLAKFLNLDVIKSLDPEIVPQPLDPANSMANVVAQKRAIDNFKWCNNGEQWISRVKREVDLSYTVAQNRAPWCSEAGRSICLESCYIFGPAWRAGVAVVNNALEVTGRKDEFKDYGEAMQSEFRYFTSEQEYRPPHPLAELTGIKTRVTGIVEQNIFYFNQVFQYGKLVSVFQEDPADASKTVMTSYFVMAANSHTLKDHAIVKDVINGDSLFNTAVGLSAGVPKYMRSMTWAIANLLDPQQSN
jgi:hypothetical protein